MTTGQWIEYLNRELEKRKWVEAAKAYAEGLQRDEIARTKAQAERDAALAERDRILKDIAAKQAKYEREMQAALQDLARVTKARAEKADEETAAKQAELRKIVAQTDAAHRARELAEGQRDAFAAEAKRESAAITARMAALRAEEQTIRERLSAALGR